MAWADSIRKKVYNKFNARCAYCGCGIKFKTFEIDHKFPKSKPIKEAIEKGIIIFSHNQIDNLMPACHRCNQQKKNLLIEEFRNKINNNLFYYEKII